MLLTELNVTALETKLAVITGTVSVLLAGQTTLMKMLVEKGLIDKAEFDQRLNSAIDEIKSELQKELEEDEKL